LPLGAHLRDFSLRSDRLRPRRRLNFSLDPRHNFTLWRREIALRACLLGIILGTAWLSLLLRDRPNS
jgi:hypothetical protein